MLLASTAYHIFYLSHCLNFLSKICFIWLSFPSLGILEECILEDHFHLLHTPFLSIFFYPPTFYSIMSYTLLDIGRKWCHPARELVISKNLLKNPKNHIWCWKNSKNKKYVLKKDHLSENLAIGALMYHQKNKKIQK